MKTLFKNIIAAVLMMTFAATFTACEEDSPENIHEIDELYGEWSWLTEEGSDKGSTCDINISTMNNSIVIQNFQNQGANETITAEVKGDSFNFDGSLANGTYQITDGHGTILNNWTMIKISYTISDGNITEKISATLTKTNVTAK
ncbi:MAG: hypothetical protein J5882_05830 [Bacteroidales bacterium]|nr:hypothetical protein [Bacteroidales bacterium]